MRLPLRAPMLALLAFLSAMPCLGIGAAPRRGGGEEARTYYTIGVLEPDRLASAWLIVRHVAQDAEILLLEEGKTPPALGEPFDLPGARWSRSASRSTYETILATEGITDPALVAIGRLIRAGELAFWLLEPGSPEERFDRKMKSFALERDDASAFAYLDRVYSNGGAPPSTP